MTDATYDPATKGGWWATTPFNTVWSRTGSSDSRLILPFQAAPAMCCTDCGGDGSGSQLDPALPPQLAAKGVSQEEWSGIMAELAAVQRGTAGLCVVLPMVLSCVLIPMVCLIGERYQADLSLWLDKLNSAHMQPRGMLAKFQTAIAGSGKYQSSRNWLTIALTPDECAQLAAESGYWRDAGGFLTGRQIYWTPSSNPGCNCSNAPMIV